MGEWPESEEDWDADMRSVKQLCSFCLGQWIDRPVPRVGHAQKQIFGGRGGC